MNNYNESAGQPRKEWANKLKVWMSDQWRGEWMKPRQDINKNEWTNWIRNLLAASVWEWTIKTRYY